MDITADQEVVGTGVSIVHVDVQIMEAVLGDLHTSIQLLHQDKLSVDKTDFHLMIDIHTIIQTLTTISPWDAEEQEKLEIQLITETAGQNVAGKMAE